MYPRTMILVLLTIAAATRMKPDVTLRSPSRLGWRFFTAGVSFPAYKNTGAGAAAGDCEHDADCDDGNVCTDDSCDPERGCQNTPNDDACDDGQLCTMNDVCSEGECSGDPLDVDDGNPCTVCICDEQTGWVCNLDRGNECAYKGDCAADFECVDCACAPVGPPACEAGADCNDEIACTEDDCVDGECVNAPTANCDDGVGCTENSCNPESPPGTSGCENVPNDANCFDRNPCTHDICDPEDPNAGEDGCVHEPVVSDDHVDCTDDLCDPAIGTFNEPNDANCDDGLFCNGAETCDPINDCQPGVNPCSDPDFPACNEDADACEAVPVCEADRDCDDSNPCTLDNCDPKDSDAGEDGCVHADVDCDDGNPCTDDYCDDESVCVNEPNHNVCDDGDACTFNDVCDPEANYCVGTPVECPDGQICADGDCVGGIGLPFDVKPGQCPNGIMRDTNAAVWAALLGTDDFDITQVRMSGIELSRANGVGHSLAAKNLRFSDESTPFEGELCDCSAVGKDHITDLRMKFKTRAMVEAFELDDLPSGAQVQLIVTGTLNDGTLFIGRDCIRIMQ